MRGAAAPVARWRRWNRAVHRDLGYLCLGLTLVYAVSGVALNHLHHWNPNYRIERRELPFPAPNPDAEMGEVVRRALALVGETRPVKSTFEPAPGVVQVFVEGNTLWVDLERGTLREERAAERPVLYFLNGLHLNRPKGGWTALADVYGVALAVLAVTGVLIPGGRLGPTRRGVWLTAAGILAPMLCLALR